MISAFLGWPVINNLLYLDGMRTFERFMVNPVELSLIGARLIVHEMDLVLNRCVFLERGSNISRISAGSLASKMINGKSVSFWAEMRRISGGKCELPQTIDDTSGEINVAILWKQKYCCLLSSVKDSEEKREPYSVLERLTEGENNVVTPEEYFLLAGDGKWSYTMSSFQICTSVDVEAAGKIFNVRLVICTTAE